MVKSVPSPFEGGNKILLLPISWQRKGEQQSFSPFEGGQRGMTYLAKFIKVRNLFFVEVVLTIYWKFIKAYFCYV